MCADYYIVPRGAKRDYRHEAVRGGRKGGGKTTQELKLWRMEADKSYESSKKRTTTETFPTVNVPTVCYQDLAAKLAELRLL